jgi:hypothetical protein
LRAISAFSGKVAKCSFHFIVLGLLAASPRYGSGKPVVLIKYPQ